MCSLKWNVQCWKLDTSHHWNKRPFSSGSFFPLSYIFPNHHFLFKKKMWPSQEDHYLLKLQEDKFFQEPSTIVSIIIRPYFFLGKASSARSPATHSFMGQLNLPLALSDHIKKCQWSNLPSEKLCRERNVRDCIDRNVVHVWSGYWGITS